MGDHGVQVERVHLAWTRTLLSQTALVALVCRLGGADRLFTPVAVVFALGGVVLVVFARRRIRAQRRATHADSPRVVGGMLLAISAAFTSLAGLLALILMF